MVSSILDQDEVKGKIFSTNIMTVLHTEGNSVRSIQFILSALLVSSSAAYADSIYNLTPGVSAMSRDVYQLHMTIFWICVVIGVLVFGAMFYAIINHRKSKGAKPAEFHSHPVLEVTWTIVPAIILMVMAIPATKVLFRMNNYDQEALTIKITGYQWKWQYEYMEDGIKFFSNLTTPEDQIQNKAPKSVNYLREVDNPVVVPIHKKIRLLITSNDVNHAWWVPDLAVKRDGIGGLINEAWTVIDKPGVYRGQCAELCGIRHAYMPIVVVATTEQGYKDWVAQQKGQASSGADVNRLWTMKELMAKGEKVYTQICAACHQPGGVGMPPTYPALKGSPIATGPVKDHVNMVINGKTGTMMQAFLNQLSDIDIASVITYERNSFGNNTNGSMVQPISIKSLRDGMTIDQALAVKPTGKAAPAATAAAPSAAAQPAAAEPAQAAAAPAALPEDMKSVMERGEKVYTQTCAACHMPAGTGMPPTFPALKGDPIVKGPVAAHIDRVLNGKQGTAMMPFKDQYKDQDIADVITYERNAWGNNTGTIVKPEDVAAARKSGQKK